MLESSLEEIGQKYNELDADKTNERDKILLDRYSKETERLKILAPTMPVQLSAIIAAQFGMDVVHEQQEQQQGATQPQEGGAVQPEPQPMPQEAPVPMQEAAPEVPPDMPQEEPMAMQDAIAEQPMPSEGMPQ